MEKNLNKNKISLNCAIKVIQWEIFDEIYGDLNWDLSVNIVLSFSGSFTSFLSNSWQSIYHTYI